MKNILIISGGTGSIALQQGLMKKYNPDSYKLDIIINAYDNGKSTGACRQVFDNDILGPSDLRKNQLTQFSNLYALEIANTNSWHYKILELFELRISKSTPMEYYYEAIKTLGNYKKILSKEDYNMLLMLINYFFFEGDKKIFRCNIDKIDFYDFSISNIFYASLAAMYNNKLSKAGEIMAKMLKIKNNVHLISDVNLYLKAITEKNNKIEDEGEIVFWSNKNDKIVEILLEDKYGNKVIPKVDEGLERSINMDLINKADIIIFSSGTQWSSLIPTYVHKGFYEAIRDSNAKKYLVMNNCEDYDMVGVNAEALCQLLKSYLPMEKIKVVLNKNAEYNMSFLSDSFSQISARIGEESSKKHDPKLLVDLIMCDYYNITCRDNIIISDLDGTLWNDIGDEKEKIIGIENLRQFEGIIFSGNSREHILRVVKQVVNPKIIGIYGDYGNSDLSKYDYNSEKYLTTKYNIEKELLEELDKIEKYKGKIIFRGNVIVTIKPLINREEEVKYLNKYLQSKFGNRYDVKLAGNTSVDITKNGFNKAIMLELLIKQKELSMKDILYLGNELDSGNEVEIKSLDLKAIQINDVYEAYMFLKTYFDIEY